MYRARCLLFYVVYNLSGAWFGLTGWLIGWLPFATRYRYITQWNHFALWCAENILLVKVVLEGEENIPEGPCVVMSKHQSQWETFYLQTLLKPLCTVLKQELLKIPFFGWGLAKLEPIGIDRSNPKQALRAIHSEGLIRLQRGRKVLIFPEGTRVAYGEKGRYARSGASLAIAADVPILPVAHNAGWCWPADEFLKRPGTVTVSIGPPILPEGRDSRELTSEVERWIEAECQRIAVTDGRTSR